MTPEQARAALMAPVPAYRKFFPDDMGPLSGMTLVTVSAHEAAKVRPTVLLFSLAALCILIGACTNVSNLLVVRSSARAAETAMRLALGAGNGRILTLAVTEGLLLSAAGTLAGVGFAWLLRGAWLTRSTMRHACTGCVFVPDCQDF